MPRLQRVSATLTTSSKRASSVERRQRVVVHDDTARTTTTTTTELEQPGGRLRRVRSFTMRSGTVVNCGDSFKGGADDGDAEQTRRRRHARRGVVDCVRTQRSRSAAASPARRRVAHGYDDDLTGAIVVGGDEATSTDTTYTVLVLGSPGVGKTTVTQQLLTSEYLANKDENVGQSDRLFRGVYSLFGRPFVKRFALCYRTVVCMSCPVCL